MRCGAGGEQLLGAYGGLTSTMFSRGVSRGYDGEDGGVDGGVCVCAGCVCGAEGCVVCLGEG